MKEYNQRLEIRGRFKKWQREHIDRYSKYNEKWRLQNPEKITVSHNAYRSLPLGDMCEFCGSVENLERHHPDYDYPHIIVTCCSTCHKYLNNGDA